MEKLKDVGKDITDLETRCIARFVTHDGHLDEITAKVNKLEPLQAHVNDLDVFAKIKNFTTQDDMELLKIRLDGYVSQLEQHLMDNLNNVERLKKVEDEFKVHVEQGFKVLERECGNIRNILGQVTAGNFEAVVNTHNALHENLRKIESRINAKDTEQTQANVNFWTELSKTQGLLQNLQNAQAGGSGDGGGHSGSAGQASGAFSSGSWGSGSAGQAHGPSGPRGEDSGADGSGGGGNMAATVGPDGRPCHCVHLQRLDARVRALERGGPGIMGAAPSPLRGETGPRDTDAWSAYRRRRNAQEGRGVPQERPHEDRPRRDPPANAEFPRMDANLEKLFDDKVALSAAYTYGGVSGGEQWRRKIRGYWVAKCPGLLPLLDWAEGMDDEEITEEELKDKAESHFWMTEVNVKRMDEVIWGFLNLATHGEAHTCFESADMLSGFEGWRLLCQHISSGQQNRRATLRQMVRNPPKINKLEDVAGHITKFDNVMREYVLTGGKLP